MQPELQYYKGRCISCGKCAQICPNQAHTFETGANGKDASASPEHAFDRGRCTACGICAADCPGNALVVAGREMSVDEVVRQALDDKPFYEESGGGVTLSGGEPVLQGDFCEALLGRLREQAVHTNLQTAGFYPYEMLERLLPYLDLVMFDIKGISPDICQNYIHRDSSPTLDSWRGFHTFREQHTPLLCGEVVDKLSRLDKSGVPIIVRMPCIKGLNDSPSEIEAIAQMLSKLKSIKYFELLPYHGLAGIKYEVLGLDFKAFEAPSKDQLEMLNGLAAHYVKTVN
jgi:pyruvate formate lyase activating enzyme